MSGALYRSIMAGLICAAFCMGNRVVLAEESTKPPAFGIYSTIDYVDEDGAGDVIGDEIYLINTGRTPYVVYLSFEGGAATPILAKARLEANNLEFSFEEMPASLVTFRGRIDGCFLTGAFFYPHERQVRLKREGADCP